MERKHLEELRNQNLEIADMLTDISEFVLTDVLREDFNIKMDKQTAEEFIEELHSEICEFVLKFVNVRLKETPEDKEKLLWEYMNMILSNKKGSIEDWKERIETFKDHPEVIYNMLEKSGKDLGILEHIFKTKVMDYEEAESYLYDKIASEDYTEEGFPYTVGQLQMLYNYCKSKK